LIGRGEGQTKGTDGSIKGNRLSGAGTFFGQGKGLQAQYYILRLD